MIYKDTFVLDGVWVERLAEKWKPIFQTVNIDKEYWGDIAMFCEQHQDEVTKVGLFTGLHVSIKIISKLDLSKVIFTDFKEICKPVKIFLGISREQLQDVRAQVWNIDIMDMLESSIIEQMSIYLNDMITNEGGVVIGDSFKIEMIDKTVQPKLEMTGYVLSFNVYRYKKLKRVRSIINDNK